eukprot:scaffold1243_cov52-Cyclotella_meneghiniana.AAC.2
MKLNIAINALAASVSTFAASASASSAVAKNPRDDRAEEGSIRAAASKNQGTECSFAVGIEVQNSPDVGVLSCKLGETCVKDSMSSIGGRCVSMGKQRGVHHVMTLEQNSSVVVTWLVLIQKRFPVGLALGKRRVMGPKIILVKIRALDNLPAMLQKSQLGKEVGESV